MDEERGLEPGTDVGGYRIDGQLGKGGMGIVYAATHPVIGKRAAIKVLRRAMSDNPATVDRFMQEARAVNQIGHPNIVDIFAFDKLPDGRCYLVMDLLAGESLRARIKRGPLPVREAIGVIDEVASALIAAHDKGFVHRDLKPDNVFLVEHGDRVDVKLLDFGLAKLMPSAGSRAFRTATGAQIGTPDYMSPEQLRSSGAIDHRSDIYSLGITALEMLTGKRPRKLGGDTFELDGDTPAQAIATLRAVTEELAQLVEAMLAVEPAGRPSLAAVRAVIKRLRPSLPAMAIVDPESAVTEPSLAALSPSLVGAKPVLPTPIGGVKALAPSPALARASATHPGTKLGVPPPPAAPTTRPHVIPRTTATVSTRESRTWIIIGAVVCAAAAIALAVVIAT